MIIMKITLKDGSFKEYEGSMSVLDITKDISEGLARVATSARVNGEVVDLRHVVSEDCELEILTFDNEEGKGAFWHTTSHIMAQAIKRLYPDTKLAIGPSIENGFYYDVDRETPFVAEDLEKIEKEMKKIVKEALPIERFTKTREEAIAYFKEKDEPYKVELIEDLPEGEEISFYQQGEFVDLCAGPHLMTTKPVKAFKLTSLAGAYWRGSEKNKMLTRIYGISYPKKALLDEYLTMLEEAKRRDHRKLGKELGLFMMCEEGPGFPFFLPKGMVLKNTLLDYWRELHKKAGYVEVSTPIILSRHLWETSGHWDHYKENMYTTQIDGEDFAIKPMNCPGGMLVYKAEPRSYKDLPLRVGELGLVHRHEKSGQLHGLMRVRCFTQDDAHIFMTPEQIKAGIESLEPVSGRFKMIETEKILIVDDCYNANPMSMKASLDVLQDGAGRRVAILGDMGELGTNEAELHREVGEHAGKCRIDVLICTGALCKNMAKAAAEANPSLEVIYEPDRESLLAHLKKYVQKEDTILVKASHFMKFEEVVEALQKM